MSTRPSQQVIPFSFVQNYHQRKPLLEKINAGLAGGGFVIANSRLEIAAVDQFGNPANKPIANFVFWPEQEFLFKGTGQNVYEYEVRGLLLDGLRLLKPVRLTTK